MWFTRTTGSGGRFYIFVSQDSRKSRKYEDRGPSDRRASAAQREVTEDIEMARIVGGIGASNVPAVTITNRGMCASMRGETLEAFLKTRRVPEAV
ncbi:dna or rna helicase of superfamily protein ii (plasmid) [Paraburkholderia caribensis MBA4]|uniref:Dna or rna helicase of superfamily protein ii n=2 Tax=Paraburkholderia caribensis TaxID=75105 RepID=A0A0P0RLR4_9BURK|nr:dna or rna helicase of superfamily protein ii [Paraburkholderia caribensis MBA4]